MSSSTSTQSAAPAMRFAQFKLVLLVHRFVKDSFTDMRESTIGAAFLTQTIQIDPATTVKFEIWDTAGQERYRSLASMYYRNAQAALVVFDITQESSLDKAKYWVKELQKQASSNIVIALVGNKLDLEQDRKISRDEAQSFANELGLILDDLIIEENPLMQTVLSRLPAEESYARNFRIITAHQLTLSAKVLPPSKVLKPEEDIRYLLPYILEAEAEAAEKEELNNIAKA
ncbi:hypothetical protein OGAPHI_005568 [Ogataea philodendri]|uniref:Uncharacterized protein n=1 Tax=Ogataea philodendri TaxID=1378263 RepID=A0A9P8NZE6_9ASCO|nr:uncharacterized protein OGAPHI_005568 [Ogataea philodendri]KAH3662317.1 hypothetical protein OGAPHI_005568 [Ogataea philodendri]